MDIFGSLAGLGQAILMDDAQASAAHTLKEALKKLQLIDPKLYRQKALEGDRLQYRNWLKVLGQVAPDLYKIREQSGALFLDALADDSRINSLATTLFEQAKGGTPADLQQFKPIIDQLVGRSQEVLNLGDRLSPEQQNTLITAGLEEMAGTGTGINRSGPAGAYIAKLLGTTTEGLRSARGAEAAGLANNAQSLTSGVDILRNNRLNILSGLVGTFQNVRNQKAALAGAGQQYVLNNAPKAGLGGSDMINMLEANRQQENQVLMDIAGINAQRDIQTGEMWSKILGNSIDAAGTIAMAAAGGGMGGAGGAGAAGAGAGGFNWGGFLSSLMGGGGQSMPVNYIPTIPQYSAQRDAHAANILTRGYY